MRKFVYLFLALLVPGLVFVFLKYAGKNRFEVPVYPLPGKALHSDCAGEVVADYTVPDSTWKTLPRSQALVIIFPVAGVDFAGLSSSIRDEIGGGIDFTDTSAFGSDSSSRARWKSCVFLLQPPQQSVLVDTQGRIRGQYDLRSLDEVDRLRVELKILTKSY